MNKVHKIIASIFLLSIGAALVGYGFTAIDFAFGNDRWSRTNDRTSTFPLFGKMTTDEAFFAGVAGVISGFVIMMVGVEVAVINYSTIRKIPILALGAVLIGWGIWGIAFSFNTAEYRVTHKIDGVDIPCFTPTKDAGNYCRISSENWFWVNVGLIVVGMAMMILSVQTSRFVKKTTV